MSPWPEFPQAALHGAATRALAATLLVALAARVLRGREAAASAIATALGWGALLWPALSLTPAGAFGRLPGLGLIVAVAALAAHRWPAHAKLVWLGALPLAAAWWLRGAPRSHEVVLLVPILVGLMPAVALARHLARRNAGLATAAAAATLAAGLALCGLPAPWIAAALVPTAAAVAMIGRPDAQPTLAAAITVLAALVIVAHDHGRLTTLDGAAALPLLVLWLFPGAPHGALRPAPYGAVRQGPAARKRRVASPQPR